MSRYEVIDEKGKWVFGWDRQLSSFFLQYHDPSLPEEDNPVIWLGATSATRMTYVRSLVEVAYNHGLIIDNSMRQKLYND